MSEQAAPSTVQAARLRQFVEQADERLSRLRGADKVEPMPARIAEISRLERLRDLAKQLLDQAEADT